MTLTDFDPAGRQMTTSIARKLRAFHVLIPGFEYRVIEAGVTYEQAVAFDLLSTPQQRCIGGPEQKCISEREQKAP